MSAIATDSTQTAASTLLQHHGERPRWLYFWGPVLLMTASVIGITHDVRHAIQAAGDKVAEHDEVESAGSNTLSRQLSIVVLGAAGAVLLLAQSSRKASQLHFGLMLALLMYMVCSVIWSDTPGTTAKRVVIPALLFLAACGIGKHWRPVDLCQGVVCMSLTFLLAGIAAEIYYGTLFANAGHRFSGLLHMNRQGMNCGALTLAAVALSIMKKQRWYLAVAAFAFCMLLATKSRGGLVAVAAAGLFFWWMASSGRSRAAAVAAGAVLAGTAMVYAGLTGDMGVDWGQLATMGRQEPGADATTLTGRIPIWMQVIGDIREKPLLGYGYGGFWTSKRVLYFSYIHNWAFSNAHSIYLESLLNLGFIGVVLGLTATAAVFLRGVKLYLQSRDPGVLFILSLVVMGAVSGLTEAIFVSIGYMLILVLTGFCVISYSQLKPDPDRFQGFTSAAAAGAPDTMEGAAQ